MALRIIKSSDPITVDNIVLTVYAQPGGRKSSLGSTARNPLLFDFDEGAHRAFGRCDSVPVKSWSDVTAVTGDDLAPYSTIVLDTAGRALDKLAADIMARDPKMGRGGALTLQGYGRLKSEFTAWLKMIRSFGLDVVLLAHVEEQKNGDDVSERIDAQGASKNEIYKVSDAMGRLAIRGGKTLLMFSPTDTAFGKNPGGFDAMIVPPFEQEPQFLAGVIDSIKAKLNAMTAEQQEVSNLLSAWREKVEGAATAKVLTDLIPEVSTLDPRIQENAKRILWAWAKDHGFTFADGAFVEAADEAKPSKRRSA